MVKTLHISMSAVVLMLSGLGNLNASVQKMAILDGLGFSGWVWGSEAQIQR